MPDIIRQPDLATLAQNEILSQNALLSKDVAQRPATDLNILINVIAALADEIAGQLIYVSAGCFVGSAQGQQLDRLAADRFGLTRKSAAGSQGAVTFSLPAPSGTTFTIPDSTKLQALDGNQFLTVGNQVFLIGDSAIIVPVRSALAGSSQNELPNQITAVTGAISGAPANLTVTNTLATFGASDDESDANFRNRIQSFFVTARRGTLSAIEQGALQVPGVVTANAIEVLDSVGRPARLVLLAITDQYTDQFANYSVVPPAYVTQSQQFAAAVFAGLNDYRAAGIYVQVTVAQVILQQVVLSLTFQAGANVDLTANLAKAAIVNYTNALIPGAPWVPANAQLALLSIPGLQITGGEIVSPQGVVSAFPLQAIRTGFGLVATAAAGGGTQTPFVAVAQNAYVTNYL